MRAEEWMKSDPARYADMEAYRENGQWRVAYESPTALRLSWDRGWLHAVAAFDPEEAKRVLAQIPPEDAVVLRGCEGLRELAADLGFNGCNPCYQAVYEKDTPVPVSTDLTIRHPDEEDFPTIAAAYHLSGEEELREDFDGPDFLGGYADGTLAGYIGLHSEGSMGNLYVFPPYRGRGYAAALYGTLINRQLRAGRRPFAQIIADNEASLNLQRKLGLRLSDGLVYWMWRKG